MFPLDTCAHLRTAYLCELSVQVVTRKLSHLLPVLLQRRHRREVARVVHQLKFLKNTVIRQHVHVDAHKKKSVALILRYNLFSSQPNVKCKRMLQILREV